MKTMNTKYEITEAPITLADNVKQVDIKEQVRSLIKSYSNLEDKLEKDQKEATNEMRTFLLGTLEIADALDRIISLLTASSGDEANKRLLGNMETTRRLLLQKLSMVGVQRLDLLGKVAPPEAADIVDVEENHELASDTVLTELIKGYLWKDKVLRRAKVIVVS